MMPWSVDAPHVAMCGICSLALSRHTVVRWSHRVAAYCTPDMGLESDVTDQVLLELVIEGTV